MTDDQKPLCCPECGGSMTFDPNAAVDEEWAVPFHLMGHPVETRRRRVAVVACDCCEYVAVVRGGRVRCN